MTERAPRPPWVLDPMPPWMNCYQHPKCKEPMCALHLAHPTLQNVHGWGDTVLGIPDGPTWVCPIGVGGSLGSSVSGRDQSIPMVVFGPPPADDTEQAAFLLGGTHAVLALRAARVLAAISEFGTDLG